MIFIDKERYEVGITFTSSFMVSTDHPQPRREGHNTLGTTSDRYGYGGRKALGIRLRGGGGVRVPDRVHRRLALPLVALGDAAGGAERGEHLGGAVDLHAVGSEEALLRAHPAVAAARLGAPGAAPRSRAAAPRGGRPRRSCGPPPPSTCRRPSGRPPPRASAARAPASAAAAVAARFRRAPRAVLLHHRRERRRVVGAAAAPTSKDAGRFTPVNGGGDSSAW